MIVHYLQIVDDEKLNPLHKKCMESVKCHMQPDDEYEVVTIKKSNDLIGTIRTVDTIKLSKAGEIPNLCVVDRDCFITCGVHEMGFTEGIPAFAQYEFNDQLQCPDLYFFFVNNNCRLFNERLKPSILSGSGYSVPLEALKNLGEVKTLTIDRMYYYHAYESMTNFVQLQELAALKLEQSYNELELTSLRKSVEQMAISMKTIGELRRR